MSEIPEQANSNQPQENQEALKAEPIGYSVSPAKFWIMSVCTMGCYLLYWAYKNFLALEVAKPKHPRVYAFIHAFFLFISLYRLIGLLEDRAEKAGSNVNLPKVFLCLLFFFAPFIEGILFRHEGYNWIDISRVCFDSFIIFLVQLKIYKLNREINRDFKPEKRFGLKEKIFCSLGILCNIIIAIGVFLPTDQSPQYVRWRFADSSNSEQGENKLEKLSKIMQFWERFSKEEKAMRIVEKGKAAKDNAKLWIEEELLNIDPNIEWDLRTDPDNPSQNILVLTSRLHWGNRPLVEEMVKQAPKTEGWKFMNTRPKAPPHLIEILLATSNNGTFNDFNIECSESKEHLINILYKESGMQESNSAESRRKAVEIVDLLIGQDNEDQWIGALVTEKSDKVLPKEEACKKFIAEFNQLKTKLLQERFEKPIVQMNEEERQNAYDVLCDAFTSFPFDSRRFSKYNEKFCYLTVKKENTFKTPEAIELKISELDKALRAENCGCALGGSFDLADKFYFDLCITDIDKATRVLRTFSSKNGYGKNSWLEFYDDIWISEWIGMEPDSTVPEMRNPDRLPR